MDDRPQCVPAEPVRSFERFVTAVRHSIGFGVETGDDDQSLAYSVGSISVDIQLQRRQEHLPNSLSVRVYAHVNVTCGKWPHLSSLILFNATLLKVI